MFLPSHTNVLARPIRVAYLRLGGISREEALHFTANQGDRWMFPFIPGENVSNFEKGRGRGSPDLRGAVVAGDGLLPGSKLLGRVPSGTLGVALSFVQRILLMSAL